MSLVAAYMETVSVIKIGGNIIDDANALLSFLQTFAKVKGKKVMVHGGGKLATRLAEQMGIQQQMVDGRRITDAETLKIITMVYAGYINKNIVAQLQANGCNAHKRVHATIDYGFVGDIDEVNEGFLKILLEQDMAVIVSPVTHDMTGQLLNTNADTIAQEIARALSKIYSVQLIYSFEKKGVLSNVDDSESVIPLITQAYYEELKSKQLIFAGMIPKLDNAFRAISQGVSKVVIGNAEQLDNLINGTSGTTIIHD